MDASNRQTRHQQPGETILQRQRLIAPIMQAGSGVDWIWGRAGSGKTRLAISIHERFDGPAAWISLDRASSDPALLIESLSRACASLVGDPPLRFSRDNLGTQSVLLKKIASDLQRKLSRQALLVIDNSHWSETLCGEAIQTLAETNPDYLKILVCSRTSYPSGIAALAGDGRAREISAANLQFTLEETAALLSQAGEIDAEKIRRLQMTTQGWPLAVMTLRDQQAPADIDESSIGRVILEIALKDLDEDLEAAVYTAAWFPLITDSLIEAIPQGGRLKSLLENWESQGLFVIRHRQADITGFELHPLLAESLRQARPDSLTGSRQPRLELCKAAILADELGIANLAASLWIEANDFEQAATLIEREAGNWMKRGRAHTIRQLIEACPQTVRDQHPWLWFWLGASTLPSDPSGARNLLERAHSGFVASENRIGEMLAVSQITASFFLSFSDANLAYRWLDKINHLSRDEFENIADAELRAGIALGFWYGLVLVEPEHPQMAFWECQLSSFAESAIDATLRVRIGLLLQKHYYYNGDRPRINRLLNQLSDIDVTVLQPYGLLVWHLIGIQHAWCNGDWLAMRRSLKQGLSESVSHGIPTLMNHMRYHGGAGLLLEGDLDGAERLLTEAPPGADPKKHMENWHGYLIAAWHSALKGEYSDAYHHAKNSEEAGLRMGGATPAAVGIVAQAYCAMLCGDQSEARQLIHHLQLESDRLDNPQLAFHALLIEARLDTDCAPANAQGLLKQAFEIGRKQQLFHFWLALPEVLTPLCRVALESGIETDYARQLIEARSLEFDSDDGQHDAWPWRLKLRTFGGFELSRGDAQFSRVLALTRRARSLVALLSIQGPRGCSTDKIADALWPDAEIEKALHSLDTTLYRLRKIIGKEAIILEKGQIRLNGGIVWTDVFYLDSLCKRIESAIRQQRNPELVSAFITQLQETCRGELLKGQDEFVDIVSARYYWENRCSSVVQRANRYLEKTAP